MIICMLQFSNRPTPDYDEVAGYLRSWGHEVWVTRYDEQGDFLWENGDGRLIRQEGPRPLPAYLPETRAATTAWRHISHFAFVRRIRRTIRELQPDIVQVNSSSLRYNSQIPIAMPSKTAFILDFRQIGDRRQPTTIGVRLRNKIRYITRRTSAVHIYDHSCYLHSAGAEYGLGENWERWGSVIPMGLHDSFLNSTRQQNNGTHDAAANRFIYVGTLTRQRQLETIFEAIRSVADKTNSFQFHFLGRDVSDGYHADLIKKLKLEQFITLVPPVPYDEVPQRLLEYDTAIAYVPLEPTDWTYHPTLKVLEYSAIGIPIIATNVAPNREFVSPGTNGFLVENTADGFAEAMLSFIEDRRLLERAKENAYDRRSGVNWLKVSQMYADLYDGLQRRQESEQAL